LHFLNAFGHDAAKTRPTGDLPPGDAFGGRLMQMGNREQGRERRLRASTRGQTVRVSKLSAAISVPTERAYAVW